MNDQKDIAEWLQEYFQENLIASVYPKAKGLRKFLTTEILRDMDNKNYIVIKLPFGIKKILIDFGDFPTVRKNVAIVGMGMIARAVHVPALISIGANIQYLVDIDQERARMVAKWCGATPITDIKDLKDSGIDYVVICVPPAFHPDIATQVMEMGFDCFVEKPIALTLDDAEKIIQVANETKKKLLVGHMRHWDPQYDEVKNLAKSGNCAILRRCLQSAPLWRGRNIKDSILEDGAVHDLDLLRVWAGNPKEFFVQKRKQNRVVIRLRFDSLEAEIDDQWVGTHTHLPLTAEYARQIIGKTFYNKIWEARSPQGERLYYHHEKDRIPLVAYQREHYEVLTASSLEQLRYRPEDALATMKLIEAIRKAPLGRWAQYK